MTSNAPVNPNKAPVDPNKAPVDPSLKRRRNGDYRTSHRDLDKIYGPLMCYGLLGPPRPIPNDLPPSVELPFPDALPPPGGKAEVKEEGKEEGKKKRKMFHVRRIKICIGRPHLCWVHWVGYEEPTKEPSCVMEKDVPERYREAVEIYNTIKGLKDENTTLYLKNRDLERDISEKKKQLHSERQVAKELRTALKTAHEDLNDTWNALARLEGVESDFKTLETTTELERADVKEAMKRLDFLQRENITLKNQIDAMKIAHERELEAQNKKLRDICGKNADAWAEVQEIATSAYTLNTRGNAAE